MIHCSKCEAYYPADSDVATCIRTFGECVDCKIKNNDFSEDDILWIKFVNSKDGASNEVKH